MKYLATKTGFYVTSGDFLITVESNTDSDVLLLQEEAGGTFAELELTITTITP
ncbi:MAG TPA: hypothetical protein VLH16_02090 [Bacteroidales bacterium]|nr:hypothetical protein [Bacteroidales bacterium]